MRRIQLLGLLLPVAALLPLMACSNASGQEQGEKPKVTKEVTPDTVKEERDKDNTTTPKRLGGDRLKGIKVKPKSPAPQVGPVRPPVTGPNVDPNAGHSPDDGHDHGPLAPAVTTLQGIGGVTVEGGNQIKDFGDLIQGDVRNHTFKAKSTGEDPLIISTLNKTCGCTRAEIKLVGEGDTLTSYQLGTPIAVGTDFIIEATLDTTGKAHRFKSDITLTTNDPRRGIGFSLSANVMPALTVNPRSLNLATMKSTDTKKGQVVLTSEAFGRFKVDIDPNIPLRDVKVELVPDSPDAEGKSDRWIAKFELGPNLPEGALNRAVRFVTDIEQPDKALPNGDPMYFDSILYVIANVQGPITVNPPHVSFGLLRPGQALTRRTTITVTDEDFVFPENPKATLKGYGVDFPYTDDFEIKFNRIEGTKNVDLVVTLLGIDTMEGNGSFRGFIEVELGHPSKPTLDVGFSGVVRAGVGQPAGQ